VTRVTDDGRMAKLASTTFDGALASVATGLMARGRQATGLILSGAGDGYTVTISRTWRRCNCRGGAVCRTGLVTVNLLRRRTFINV
jgi:hypothetical protein